MKVLATARGERVASTTRGESTAVWRDAVRATSRGGRGDEEVVEDLRGVTEAAAARRDDRGGTALRLRPQRCRAISRGGEPGVTGACYGCALDASGASEPWARVRACG